VQRFDGAVAPNPAQLVRLDAVVRGTRQRHMRTYRSVVGFAMPGDTI
jgi:hypothetical protein